jgi:hypothetical protein
MLLRENWDAINLGYGTTNWNRNLSNSCSVTETEIYWYKFALSTFWSLLQNPPWVLNWPHSHCQSEKQACLQAFVSYGWHWCACRASWCCITVGCITVCCLWGCLEGFPSNHFPVPVKELNFGSSTWGAAAWIHQPNRSWARNYPYIHPCKRQWWVKTCFKWHVSDHARENRPDDVETGAGGGGKHSGSWG